MDRRRFTQVCSGLLAGAASLHASATTPSRYRASALYFDNGKPVTLDALERGEAWIFSYPYKTTPCFLIRLSTSAPGQGSWPGGIGDDQSVVAFSAICSHKMSHPAKPITHISYRDEPVSWFTKAGEKQTRSGVISCCSERSVYDPAEGASVLSGPAPTPLAAIALEVSENGTLTATGSQGPDVYEKFLDAFGFRLAMEYNISDASTLVDEQTMTVRASDFSAQQMFC